MYQLMMCHSFRILQAPRYTLQKTNTEDQKKERNLLCESLHFALKILHLQTVPPFTTFLIASVVAQYTRGVYVNITCIIKETEGWVVL